MSSAEITIIFDVQEGRRVGGVVTSQNHKEPIIGIIGLDGKTVRMQDNDGALDGTLSDPDTLESVYRHSAPHSILVSAITYKRQK